MCIRESNYAKERQLSFTRVATSKAAERVLRASLRHYRVIYGVSQIWSSDEVRVVATAAVILHNVTGEQGTRAP